MIDAVDTLLAEIRQIHAAIRDEVVATCEREALSSLSAIVGEQAGDTIFAIDRVSEKILLHHFAALGEERSFILVAEGIGEDGRLVFPRTCPPEQAELFILIDPIDGTRGIMYQKRPAWILTGVARNHGAATTLADIELAVQTEIPLVKQHLSDTFWAIAGQGAHGERYNRITGKHIPFRPQPSQATTIAQGYGNIARFFPGPRAALASIDDTLIDRILGPSEYGRVRSFEDQYICSGGQLAELIAGHDRWMADLRPLAEPFIRAKGQALGLTCHPYDLCTELIAREAHLIITDEYGERLHAPLDVTTGVSWIGYANQAIHDQVAPILHEILLERSWIAMHGTEDDRQ